VVTDRFDRKGELAPLRLFRMLAQLLTQHPARHGHSVANPWVTKMFHLVTGGALRTDNKTRLPRGGRFNR
jgi:hypothetical protein